MPYKSIYGAGQVHSPKIMLIFMNPTARNIAADPSWEGIRAPWIGTKKVWQLLQQMNLVGNEPIFNFVLDKKPAEWTQELAYNLYKEVAASSIYITNIAKCTLNDARPVSNLIYKQYLDLLYQEILEVNPKKVTTFGNQVSSLILDKPISVSNYQKNEFENIRIKGKPFVIYPTYYPVGQGQRNMPKAIKRIKSIL